MFGLLTLLPLAAVTLIDRIGEENLHTSQKNLVFKAFNAYIYITYTHSQSLTLVENLSLNFNETTCFVFSWLIHRWTVMEHSPFLNVSLPTQFTSGSSTILQAEI